MIDISSGDARLDAFLADGYMRIRGMSSRFAVAICGRVIPSGAELVGSLPTARCAYREGDQFGAVPATMPVIVRFQWRDTRP